MLFFQRILDNLIGLHSAFFRNKSHRVLERRNTLSNTAEKRTETRDWVKVSINELSVFYPRKTKGTLLKTVQRTFQGSRFGFLHHAKLVLFLFPALVAATSYRKMFPPKTFTSQRHIDKFESFSPVRSRHEDSNSDRERDSLGATVQAQKVMEHTSQPDSHRPKARQSETRQPVLDPFKCSPAKNSLLKGEDVGSHSRSEGDLWLVCR